MIATTFSRLILICLPLVFFRSDVFLTHVFLMLEYVDRSKKLSFFAVDAFHLATSTYLHLSSRKKLKVKEIVALTYE